MKKGLFSLYWRVIFSKHRRFSLLLLGLMLGGAILQMATVGLGVPLLETATNNTMQGMSGKIVAGLHSLLSSLGIAVSNNIILLSLLLIVCAAVVLSSCATLLQQYGSATIAKTLYREVKARLFDRTLRAEVGYLMDKSRGTILYNINNPSVAVFQVISVGCKLASALLNAVMMVGLMFYLSWWATAVIGLVGIVWVQFWRQVIDKRSARCGHQLYDLESRVNRLEVDAIDGMKVVKAHGLVAFLVGRQEKILGDQLKPHVRLALLINGIVFINDMAACGVVVALAGVALGLGWGHLSFARLVIFFVALRRVSPALASINSGYAQLNKEKKNVEILDEILHTVPVEQQGYRLIDGIDAIQLDHLEFSYPAKPEKILQGVHLTLKKGQITALVGKTGSGKSTVAGLLLRFYKPNRGYIFVNGTDLADLDLNAWREKIGYVCQDVFLFNDTIRNNICVWEEKFGEADIEQAARLAQLHELIATLPDGYDTIVGDRGLKLSGGQAQRIAIARAILRKPQVLIFDEATSALDNLTEKAVFSAIRSLRETSIVVVIAHRLSTIRDADQIAVLQSGKIVELGMHDVLIQQNSIYAKLYHGAETRHPVENDHAQN